MNFKRFIPHKHQMEYKGRKYYFTLDKKEIYSRGKYKCKFCGKEKIF